MFDKLFLQHLKVSPSQPIATASEAREHQGAKNLMSGVVHASHLLAWEALEPALSVLLGQRLDSALVCRCKGLVSELAFSNTEWCFPGR